MPRSYLETELSGGVIGGLQHSYVLTTYAAQGATFAIAAPLITDASSREGVYVSTTRGQFDLQAVIVRRNVLRPPLTDDDLPVLRDETRALLATARSLEADGPERLAREIDPFAARVHALANELRLPEVAAHLAEGGSDTDLYERVIAERGRIVGSCAVLSPDRKILDHLGPRPEPGPLRGSWDQAVGTIALWHEREQVETDDDVPGVEWAVGPRPVDPELREDYDLIAGLVSEAAAAWAANRPPANERPAQPTPEPQRSRSRYENVSSRDLVARHQAIATSIGRHEQSVRLLERTLERHQAMIDERRSAGLDQHSLLVQVQQASERLESHRAALEELFEGAGDIAVELTERGFAAERSEAAMVPAARAEPTRAPEPPSGPEIKGPTIGI